MHTVKQKRKSQGWEGYRDEDIEGGKEQRRKGMHGGEGGERDEKLGGHDNRSCDKEKKKKS